MSVNQARPHIFLLPEDDANRQLANGFHAELDWTKYRQFQVLPVANGWHNVLTQFVDQHIPQMGKNSQRLMILLIDLDGNESRLEQAKAMIPDHLAERVIILSTKTQPEDLRKAKLGSYEAIGKQLAVECREDTDATWAHQLLQHNAQELKGLREQIRQVLF